MRPKSLFLQPNYWGSNPTFLAAAGPDSQHHLLQEGPEYYLDQHGNLLIQSTDVFHLMVWDPPREMSQSVTESWSVGVFSSPSQSLLLQKSLSRCYHCWSPLWVQESEVHALEVARASLQLLHVLAIIVRENYCVHTILRPFSEKIAKWAELSRAAQESKGCCSSSSSPFPIPTTKVHAGHQCISRVLEPSRTGTYVTYPYLGLHGSSTVATLVAHVIPVT